MPKIKVLTQTPAAYAPPLARLFCSRAHAQNESSTVILILRLTLSCRSPHFLIATAPARRRRCGVLEQFMHVLGNISRRRRPGERQRVRPPVMESTRDRLGAFLHSLARPPPPPPSPPSSSLR